MRFASILVVITIILFAGCASQAPSQPQGPGGEVAPGKTCHLETSQVPITKEECGLVSYTEPVCGLRKLNYSVSLSPKVDLCIQDSGCTGEPLGDCQACTKAMTRCILTVNNLEQQKTGTWIVGANYTLGNAAFLKDPMTKEIRANESYAFDFDQIYNPGQPIGSAACEVFVVQAPYAEDCHDETRTRNECKNVTTTETVQKEVCE